MTTKRAMMPLAVLLGLLLTAVASAPSQAKPSSADRHTARLAGAWQMTKLEIGTPGNLTPVPYSGQVVFTAAGTMSVQAMNPDTSAPDTPYTVNGYEAFDGSFTVNQKAGTLTVAVESSVVRDLIGQRLTRVFQVSAQTLVLTPTDPAEGWRVTYHRL